MIDDLVPSLAATPGRLREANLTSEGEARQPGQWNAQEVVLHVVAVELDVFQNDACTT